jgi:hypothetical protein
MYYQRLDARAAILDYAKSSASNGVRECAIYNKKARTMQRYSSEDGYRQPVTLDVSEFNHASSAETSAFYCSYWHYDSTDFANPIGRDLVWTVRAKDGGLFMAKFITKLVLEALDEAGVIPWVKYSGDLGFDIIIPLQSIPNEIWMSNTQSLDNLQHELTSNMASHIHEKFPEAEVDTLQTSATIKIGSDVCRLSELRVKRGLLLAPMSLNPQTGLVSLPISRERIDSFKIFDATKELARPTSWTAPVAPTYGLLKYAAGGVAEASESAVETD